MFTSTIRIQFFFNRPEVVAGSKLTAFQEVEDNIAALRILENETQTTTAGRCVIGGLSSTFYESLQGRCRHLPSGHHRADRRAS
jgi:hypothetical protein